MVQTLNTLWMLINNRVVNGSELKMSLLGVPKSQFF
jgi:hypothetical protein